MKNKQQQKLRQWLDNQHSLAGKSHVLKNTKSKNHSAEIIRSDSGQKQSVHFFFLDVAMNFLSATFSNRDARDMRCKTKYVLVRWPGEGPPRPPPPRGGQTGEAAHSLCGRRRRAGVGDLLLPPSRLEFTCQPQSSSHWVLSHRRIKTHLCCDDASCQKYIPRQKMKTAFMFNLQRFVLKYSKCPYAPEMWSRTRGTLSPATHFSVSYLWEEKISWKKRVELRKHSPDSNGAELNKCPNRNQRVDPRNHSIVWTGSVISFSPF